MKEENRMKWGRKRKMDDGEIKRNGEVGKEGEGEWR